jgi:hypothetical protein
MDRDGVNQLAAMVDVQIQGMLGRKNTISYRRNLQEFGA